MADQTEIKIPSEHSFIQFLFSISCTSDEESEYLTRSDMAQQKDRRKLLKLAIAQHTIIEKSAENLENTTTSPLSYKKRLAQSETSL